MKIYKKNIILPAGIGWEKAAYKRGYEDGEEAQKEKLISTSITENGTYTAEDGFSEVEVNVEGGGNLQPLNLTYMMNGFYDITAEEGYDGFMSPIRVVVDVPQTGYTQQDLDNAYASGMTAGYQSGWTEAMEECQRDWSKEYLTIEALSGGTLNVNQPLDSSTNKGEWASHESGYTLTLNAGDRVRFRGTALGRGAFSGNTLAFNVMGNAGSVIAGDDYEEVDNPGGDGMRDMFNACSGLTDASKLILPPKVASLCYLGMFAGCTSLIAAPELPATVMQRGCYESMFYECSSLEEAPALPATTLAEACYKWMFHACTSLTKAPELPAMNMAEECYAAMFQLCTSLTTTPELPATTLAKNCYWSMFYSCSNIEAAPELPATSLSEGCYKSMFGNCPNLVFAPELPATTLAVSCYKQMFYACSKLVVPPALSATTLVKECYSNMFGGCLNMTSAPDLPAAALVESCYYHMFDACVRLAHIKCLATDISAVGCTEGWFNGHRPNGTFTKAAGMNDWTRGVDGIPAAWTVRDAS